MRLKETRKAASGAAEGALDGQVLAASEIPPLPRNTLLELRLAQKVLDKFLRTWP
jgi:hypothetical protein